MSGNTLVAGIRGSGVTIAGSVITLGIQFSCVAVLSRLLSPEDFGLVAMIGVFIALGNLLRDFGIPMAALQAKSLSRQQASNLFWANVALAALASGLLILATPVLVHFYSENRLAHIIPVMAGVVLINGIGAQIQIELARSMRFTTLVVSDISGQVLGFGVAVTLALHGAGYWALVIQGVVAAVVTVTMRFVACRWRPLRFRRGHHTGALFRSGAQYGSAYFLTFVQNNVDTLIIGSTIGATALGYYNRGYQLLTAPYGRLMDPLTQVVISTLRRLDYHGPALQRLLLRIQFAVGCGGVWLFAVCAGTAGRLVPLALGGGWTPTIVLFQLLAIGGGIGVLSHVSYWIFIYHGQSRELLRYNLVSKPLSVACIAVGSAFGVRGVACGYVAAMALSWPLNLWWLSRCADLPLRAFAKNGITVLLAGALGAAASMGCMPLVQAMPAVPAITIGILAGTLAMAAGLLLLPDSRTNLIDIARAVRRLWNGRHTGQERPAGSHAEGEPTDKGSTGSKPGHDQPTDNQPTERKAAVA